MLSWGQHCLNSCCLTACSGNPRSIFNSLCYSTVLPSERDARPKDVATVRKPVPLGVCITRFKAASSGLYKWSWENPTQPCFSGFVFYIPFLRNAEGYVLTRLLRVRRHEKRHYRRAKVPTVTAFGTRGVLIRCVSPSLQYRAPHRSKLPHEVTKDETLASHCIRKTSCATADASASLGTLQQCDTDRKQRYTTGRTRIAASSDNTLLLNKTAYLSDAVSSFVPKHKYVVDTRSPWTRLICTIGCSVLLACLFYNWRRRHHLVTAVLLLVVLVAAHFFYFHHEGFIVQFSRGTRFPIKLLARKDTFSLGVNESIQNSHDVKLSDARSKNKSKFDMHPCPSRTHRHRVNAAHKEEVDRSSAPFHNAPRECATSQTLVPQGSISRHVAAEGKCLHVTRLPYVAVVLTHLERNRNNLPKKLTSELFWIQLQHLWETCDGYPLPPAASWQYRPVFVRCVLSKHEATLRIAQLLYRGFPRVCRALWPAELCHFLESTTLDLGHTLLPRAGATGLSLYTSLHTHDPAVYTFETQLFKGRLLLRVKGTSSDDIDPYFVGRKRVTQYVIQGSFKKRLRFDQALMGQYFEKPWTSLPPKLFVKLIMSFVGTVLPAFQADVSCEKPYFVFPLVSSIQVLSITDRGSGTEPPSITDPHLVENTYLLGPPFNTSTYYKDASYRKKTLSNTKTLRNYYFHPEYIYTMEFYQHLLDINTYCVELPIKQLDLSSYLSQQPIELAAFVRNESPVPSLSPYIDSSGSFTKLRDKQRFLEHTFLWNLQIWHEKLL